MGKKGMSRRHFLTQTGLAAAGGALLGGRWAEILAAPAAGAGIDLAVVRGPAAEAAEKAVALLGGMGRFVKQGDRVVLKPNMSFSDGPEEATNTSPELVAKVAELCRKAGARQVLVLDYTLRRPELCLERSRIRDYCERVPETRVFALNERKFFREVPVPEGKALKQVEVMRDVLDSEVLINLPTAKSHGGAKVSLGMKNLMGLIWDRASFHGKYGLDRAIADLSTVIRPRLIILDATRALTEGGPGGPGRIERPQTVVAGTDPVAVDAFGVGLAKWYGKGFEPREIKHIVYASELGLGQIDPAKLKIERAEVL